MNDMTVPSTISVTIDPTIEFFTDPAKVDAVLAEVRRQASAFQADVSSPRGRKAIASVAYAIARTKTSLDNAGKALVDKQKEIPKKIDAGRKTIRDSLDALQETVRSPLTAWEKDEEDRINAIKQSLAEIEAVIADHSEQSAAAIRAKLDEMIRMSISDQLYGDMVDLARDAQERAVDHLTARLAAAEKREADGAELQRLRAADAARVKKEREEAAAREQQEREAQIAREAAERAATEAAAKVAAAEKAAADASERERAAIAHAANVAQETEARIKREAEEAAAREAAETAARERDVAHKKTINRAAVAALVGGGVDEKTAKIVITMIAKGYVPAVSISY